MKVFRRVPVAEPGARERALARLAARPPTHAPTTHPTDDHLTNNHETDTHPASEHLTNDQPTDGHQTGNRSNSEQRTGDVPADRWPAGEQSSYEYPEERDEEVRGGWIPEQVRPERLRDARWTISARHVLVLAAVLAVGLSWAAWSLFRARPETLPDTRPSIATTGSPVAQPTSATNQPSTAQSQPGANQSPGASQWPGTNQSPGTNSGTNQSPGANQSPGTSGSPGQPLVVVYVSGKVRRPGLVRAPAGSRVADVLALAGGPLRGVDLTTLNLARQVTDGEQIIVGQPAQLPPTNPPATTNSSTPGAATTAPVDLNTATLDELDGLPGVGPVLAQRILDYRTQNGPFTTIDQLQEVPGVGPKKFDSLKPHVRI